MATDRLSRMSLLRHSSRLLAIVALVAVLDGAAALHGQGVSPQPAKGSIPASAERAYAALAPLVNGDAAMEVVRFMDQYWRIAGNPGFNASVDHIKSQLEQAGVETRVDEFTNRGRGWDYQVGSVSFADTGKCCSRRNATASRCASIRSLRRLAASTRPLSTSAAGAAAADYEGKVVKGAVVLGSADAGRLWQQAVKARGAVGFISTSIAPYIRPNDPAAFTSPDQQDVFQWGRHAVRRRRQGLWVQGELACGGADARAAEGADPFT